MARQAIAMNAQDIDDIDLHDGTLDAMAIAFDDHVIEINVSYYPDQESSAERVRARITFSGVSNTSEVLDFAALAHNRGFGNISYWHPVVGAGTTYIYLTSGLIAITAREMRFEPDA